MQELNIAADPATPRVRHENAALQKVEVDATFQAQPLIAKESEIPWNHSSHIIDFVKVVVEENTWASGSSQGSEILSSLRRLVETLENSNVNQQTPRPNMVILNTQVKSTLPPLEAVVSILRWAKGTSLLVNK